ncbi:ABC transporter substrate-binding protein [Salinibacterium sp. NSLL150]|uniref:ABC transporter substrate-binding protein n=1 Tax=unclassified Salinibacterium TaxID=2632331 RepID=UPI0018CDC05C|nr:MULTISPECIES: ABC transporter substrate-binding protein [unclassified Salinibacterium]MBH0098893.1 ABC transporter substrate-binding protein [Salinibacterium sp. NSLL35]MBH0101648.1 ABC transporter substrate-binding protein [Salinibacterium sp. NSLL150]MBH0104407.1 ABC transporter substrate-binding protein [Salinibacterium sp. NSLL16]MBH0107168.1 ABC transporter substrate-binding protein [Salinibacterium sp. NSLL17]MBH0109052.1 ABC transporter substrate-binding protein [Salinibacterium sp. 
MFTAKNKGRLALGAAAVGVAIALSGCATSDPLDTGSSDDNASSDTIVVGSQAYYSNEIIAEIYSQALENAGFDVERQFQIGQRDAYLPALESGEVDIMPEYTGNLLQFYSADTTATASDEVYAELAGALPEGLTVLDQASATDQDSYNVTADFAADNSLTTLADLAGVSDLQLGGNAELEERPYGPAGLQDVYGATVGFTATGDTTVDALVAGTINMANVYSADPRIQTEGLVTLADPEGLFLASNVVPIVNADIADSVADVLNAVSAKLTPEGLVALNVQSTVDKMSSDDIASAWLSENGLS